MHDSVISAGRQVGVRIIKEDLYRQQPPQETEDTSLAEIMAAPVVNSSLSFVREI